MAKKEKKSRKERKNVKLFLYGDEIVIDTVNQQTLLERKRKNEKEKKLYCRNLRCVLMG